MFNINDLQLLKQKGITPEQIEQQLHFFATNFPYLKIISAATPNNGIELVNNDNIAYYLEQWDNYLAQNCTIVKFVPASGAASRMFKDLFAFIEGKSEMPEKEAEKEFFEQIEKFAFYDLLNNKCVENEKKNIAELIAENQYKTVIENLLLPCGLNYGSLPKGLLLFHSYAAEKRTPAQEHLVEGAMYAANSQHNANIHFTVSAEHRQLFDEHIKQYLPEYKNNLGRNFSVSFSEQKPSTDTIAADSNNEPFRENGELLFRPGGHGALIENLNDIDADIIFIKNIDNVVPDSMKNATVIYKKVIAGYLVNLQKQNFKYLKELENENISIEKIREIASFCEHQLNNINPIFEKLTAEEKRKYLFGKLNRPIRVCGMVKNTGEPGGGPFLTVNVDETISAQILESSQIDMSKPEEKDKMLKSTHFNPVDLVCGVKNYKGEKFDLLRFVDKNTGFISLKSKNGKELKALELPGLWNGAMSDWNNVFVEVPIDTFNPVKTVNDLLRVAHQ